MGRRKITIEMVKDSSSRQVTFSKRRTGLFKKANELATLCAAQVSIVVFSPGGKPFSFGHPDVDSVSDRFLNQDNKQKCQVDTRKLARVEKLDDHLNDVMKELRAEKKRGEMLNRANEKLRPKPTEESGLDDLLKMKGAFEELRENLKKHASEMEASSSLLLLSQKPVEKCSSSGE